MIELGLDEGRMLRDLLLGEPTQASRELAIRLEPGAAPAAARPNGEFVSEPEAAARKAERTLHLVKTPIPSMLEGLATGALRTRPQILPALDSLRRMPFALAERSLRALPFGVYALAIDSEAHGAGGLICARIREGRLERLVGGTALGLGEGLPETPKWLEAAGRLGPLRLALEADPEGLRAILRSSRPISCFERLRIRQELWVHACAMRVDALFFALRLVGR